jgi:CMP-N-acetylneuraminic acid synthetase
MYNLGLICVRGNSKGVKNKNIKNFCGKPLIYWTINQLKKVNSINRIIVSTDSKKIAEIAKKFGAEILFMRPKELSKDNSPEWKVWRHVVKFLKDSEKILPKMIINMPVTSPCRKLNDIKKGIDLFSKDKFELVTAVRESDRNPYFNMVTRNKNSEIKIVIKSKYKIINRQAAPNIFDMTTLFHILKPQTIMKKNNIFDCKVGTILVDKISSIDIDTKDDFKLAQLLFKKFRNAK